MTVLCTHTEASYVSVSVSHIDLKFVDSKLEQQIFEYPKCKPMQGI